VRVAGDKKWQQTKGWLCLLVLLVAGCGPVISQNVLKDVDRDLPFQEIQRDPDNFKGKTILLGGKIIETIPLPDKTRIMILQYPLGFRDKPIVDSGSEGRFIVEATGFLDPDVFTPGRQVTVAGIVGSKELIPLGEINYAYPIVLSREIYLWPVDDI
jgi:outer membrane lipoprotein